jgi:hypothetical protein
MGAVLFERPGEQEYDGPGGIERMYLRPGELFQAQHGARRL